jgi:hypothetical protein
VEALSMQIQILTEKISEIKNEICKLDFGKDNFREQHPSLEGQAVLMTVHHLSEKEINREF